MGAAALIDPDLLFFFPRLTAFSESRAWKYPLLRHVGVRGTRMSAERQKIRAAEWLYRWSLSSSIIGIVFTILSFMGVFTLVLGPLSRNDLGFRT